ncbi:MAG: hypothetical protein AAF936_03845 [Pseudomonadota bacterium]
MAFFLKYPNSKIDILYEALINRVKHPHGKAWNESARKKTLSEFVVIANAIRRGQQYKENDITNFATTLPYDKDDYLGETTQPRIDMIKYAYGVPPDATWFRCQRNEDNNSDKRTELANFRKEIDALKIPEIFSPKIGYALEERSRNTIGKSIAGIDFFTSPQFESLAPVLAIKLGLIRVPEAPRSFAYGFSSLVIDLEFTGGQNVRLINRRGLEEPIKLENGYVLTVANLEGAPQWVLREETSSRPVSYFGEIAEIGELINVKEGDAVTATLMAALDQSVLAFEDPENSPPERIQEIYSLLINEQILYSGVEKTVHVTEDKDFIVLATQVSEVVRRVDK